MATIIWCDRVRHIVEEPRSQVAEIIGNVKAAMARGRTCSCGPTEACSECPNVSGADGFLYVTPVNTDTQIALNVEMISSFQALPGDGI